MWIISYNVGRRKEKRGNTKLYLSFYFVIPFAPGDLFMLSFILLFLLAFALLSFAVFLVLINAVSRICCWLGVHEPGDIVRVYEYGDNIGYCARCGRRVP